MNNTYITSAVFTLRTKASLSFSQFNDCNLIAQRFDNNPLSKHCCCSCCSCSSSSSPSSYVSSFVTHRLPAVTPSLFYGLRQSTLIQFSPCKRLIFGGRDRYYYWVPDYDIDHGCLEVSCSFKEKGDWKRIERRSKGRFRGLDSCERRCLTNDGDVDAVISLLSDDQNGSSSNRLETKRRGNNHYGGDCQQRKKKNLKLESKSRSRMDLLSGEFRKEDYRRKGEREDCQRKKETEERRREEERSLMEENEGRKAALNGENRKERKASSSFSSYYSLSSTGDFESNKEAHDELVGSLEEFSSGYKKGLWHGENRFREEVTREVSEHRTSTTRTGADWDLRKKTEKKLAEIEETKSRKESSPSLSNKAWSSESEYRKSSSYEQIGSQKEEPTLAVKYEKGTKKQFNQKSDLAATRSQFITDYQEIADTQEIKRADVKATSQYRSQFNGREENLKIDADLVMGRRGYDKTISEVIGNDTLRKSCQQYSHMLEVGYGDTERASNLQTESESRMKIHEEERARMSVFGTSEKHQQSFQQVTGQFEPRRVLQQSSKVSEISGHNTRNKSILQSGTEMKKQEGSIDASYMVGQSNELRFHGDQKDFQRIQSGKGFQNIANISMNITSVSVVNASDKERAYDSKITSDKGAIDQESESTSFVKPGLGTEERYGPAGKITELKSRNKTDSATEVVRFEGKASQGASSSQISKSMTSQERIQQTHVDVENYRSLQAMTIPPSVQVVDRGPLHVNPTSGTATHEVQSQTSETSSSALYTNLGGRTSTSLQKPYGLDGKGDIYGEPLKLLAPEDAMGSACRLEESSMQFVGEFMETAKNEASSFEIQRDKNSDQELVEREKDENSSQYGVEDLPLKEQRSQQLSGVSGQKGPSDEMWDVTGPAIQEFPETKAPEGSTAVSATVIRKTGRSLWNIIADVVRLRWGSLSETSKSARRSGGKSSNDSVSEAWFSGNDREENSDKNVEREKSMSKEASFSHQVQLETTPSQGRGEVSDTIRSKSKIRQLEVDMSSPSTTWKSGSTSKGMSSPSEEEHLVWEQDGKSREGTTDEDRKSSHVFAPSMEVGESSSSRLPTSSMDAFIVEESYGGFQTDVSVSCAMEQPASSKSTGLSGPEGIEGELKRRKLQRNKQVLRDRFDEWEEAYMRESEQRKIDEMFMREALLEAKKAADTWEVPVGAVLVQHGKIVARGYNLVEELRDSTAHAEMICIREASNQLRTWRLAETTLYVTLEPCPMCAGAILQARVDTLVWGAPNKLLGADGSWIRLFPNGGGGNGAELMDKPPAPVHPFHPNMTIRRGILASECAETMQQFFQLRRRKKTKSVDAPPKPSLPIASHQSKILNKMHDIFHALLCL